MINFWFHREFIMIFSLYTAILPTIFFYAWFDTKDYTLWLVSVWFSSMIKKLWHVISVVAKTAMLVFVKKDSWNLRLTLHAFWKLLSTEYLIRQKFSAQNFRRTKSFGTNTKGMLSQLRDKIFGTKPHFRQFCPPDFCPIRYLLRTSKHYTRRYLPCPFSLFLFDDQSSRNLKK